MNSKTRVVNYRKRLLEKPEIYRQIKEKDAERKGEERRKMTEDEKILRCEKDRRRKQKSREANAAKAAEVLLVNEIIPRKSERIKKNADKTDIDMALQKKIISGIEVGLEIRILKEKGRGIITTKKYAKHDFICEYAGELINIKETRKSEAECEKTPEAGAYMYFFSYKSRKYCVDATKQTTRYGCLLNHSKINNNTCTKVYLINDVPHLIFVATEEIEPGMELLYDYGDHRKKSVEFFPWLNC